jgi:hypothetical protein
MPDACLSFQQTHRHWRMNVTIENRRTHYLTIRTEDVTWMDVEVYRLMFIARVNTIDNAINIIKDKFFIFLLY